METIRTKDIVKLDYAKLTEIITAYVATQGKEVAGDIIFDKDGTGWYAATEVYRKNVEVAAVVLGDVAFVKVPPESLL